MNLYLENYGIYAELIQNKRMVINIRDITLENYEYHYNCILNIMKDTIETEYMRTVFITLNFGGNLQCDLSIQDYWVNIIMWYHIIKAGDIVQPKHLFFEPAVTRGNIKAYIDKFFIGVYLKTIDIIDMNNIIDDALYRIIHVDKFSWYLANTINLEDFIDLMKKNARFYELLHADLSKVNVEDVKSEGMKLADESIELIMQSEHGLANFFRAREGINIKQYKEFGINIGTKPDGKGGIFPSIINRSFIMGGVNDLMSFYIESNNGRTAQIIVDKNVGGSGAFARLLGLNNSDSRLHHDKNYVCNTRNFQRLFITNEDVLNRYNGRYYRLIENGMTFRVTSELDYCLIGKTILLYSPMTCASAARGEGICYRCYGDLAYINKDISIGKLASELLSSVLTQKMLSAKHLLEATVIALNWNKEFVDYFDVEFNIIKCKQDVDYSHINIIINTSEITPTEDEDELSYIEYVNSYSLLIGNQTINFSTEKGAPLYIESDLSNMIRTHGKPYGEDEVSVNLQTFKDEDLSLFSVQIYNNDLNAILEKIQGTINNKATVDNLDKDGLLQQLLSNLKEGGLDLAGVHAEIILANQLRDIDDPLAYPDWSVPNQKYVVKTLKSALKDNPSISVSLAFESIKKALYNPLTFKKYKPSVFDLFFMEKPQEFLYNQTDIIQKEPDKDENGLNIVYKRIEKVEDNGNIL